jgi:hypothetical protein
MTDSSENLQKTKNRAATFVVARLLSFERIFRLSSRCCSPLNWGRTVGSA